MPVRPALLSILLCAVALGACTTSTHLPQDRADRFRGGPLTNFGGTDGDDAAVRAAVRQLCEGREYDFTPSGFQLTAGTVFTTTGLADPVYPGGEGLLEFRDPPGNVLASVDLTIDPGIPPRAGSPTLSCTFNAKQAQNAINTPDQRFAVNWRITLLLDEEAKTITADQVLMGIDFIAAR